MFRPGFFAKVSRTSVLEHYGLKTLLYGVLLPAPDIGREAAAVMRSVRDAGHECGIHTWDHVLWQDNVRQRDRAWTEQQMRLAHERFCAVFGAPPTHPRRRRLADERRRLSPARRLGPRLLPPTAAARAPYVPQVDGRTLAHVQLPTTLPTLDELLGVDGRDESAVVAELPARRPPRTPTRSSRCTPSSRAAGSRRRSPSCSPAGRPRGTGW